MFANLTGVNKNVTYRVQPVLAPNCFGAPVDVIITIRPQPVIVPGQTKIVCSGVPIGKEIFLIPANTPAGTLFNWGLPAMSDASVQGTAGVNVAADPALTIHINDALNNYSSAPITATYTVTPDKFVWLCRESRSGYHYDQPGACSPANCRTGRSLRRRKEYSL